jgi:hypothetical protein
LGGRRATCRPKSEFSGDVAGRPSYVVYNDRSAEGARELVGKKQNNTEESPYAAAKLVGCPAGLLSSLNMLVWTTAEFGYTGSDCARWMHKVGFRRIRSAGQ